MIDYEKLNEETSWKKKEIARRRNERRRDIVTTIVASTIIAVSLYFLYTLVLKKWDTINYYNAANEACLKAVPSGTKVFLEDTTLVGYVENGGTIYFNAPEDGCEYLIRWHTENGLEYQWLSEDLIQNCNSVN